MIQALYQALQISVSLVYLGRPRRAPGRPFAFSYGYMPELTCISHSHIYIDIYSARSADSRFQNVFITTARYAASVAAIASVAATATAAAAAAAAAAVTATAIAPTKTKAAATTATTANNAYWHGEGSLEPYLGLR